MIRLFLAVTPPPTVRKSIFGEIKRLKRGLPHWKVNWVKEENLHLTLIFLGWVKEGQEETIKKETDSALKDVKRFKVAVENSSARNHPIWLEASQGKEDLIKLQRQILSKLSFGSKKSRPFLPHLTLGRVNKKGKEDLQSYGKRFVWEVKEVILYQSQLHRNGSIYKELAAFSLKG